MWSSTNSSNRPQRKIAIFFFYVLLALFPSYSFSHLLLIRSEILKLDLAENSLDQKTRVRPAERTDRFVPSSHPSLSLSLFFLSCLSCELRQKGTLLSDRFPSGFARTSYETCEMQREMNKETRRGGEQSSKKRFSRGCRRALYLAVILQNIRWPVYL